MKTLAILAVTVGLAVLGGCKFGHEHRYEYKQSVSVINGRLIVDRFRWCDCGDGEFLESYEIARRNSTGGEKRK